MTARRIVVAVLALAASVTVGIYAQGGGGGAQEGGAQEVAVARAGGGGPAGWSTSAGLPHDRRVG